MVASWCCGKLTWLQVGVVASRRGGKLAWWHGWRGGKLEWWQVGVVTSWQVGKLAWWQDGVVAS